MLYVAQHYHNFCRSVIKVTQKCASAKERRFARSPASTDYEKGEEGDGYEWSEEGERSKWKR